jgi:ABC-type multidrug transport system ATPase subunit
VLAVRELHKRFGRLEVLTGLSLELVPGEIYGLLGPNGAGKSTALKIVTGLVRADRGHVRIDGVDLAARPREALRRVGAQIESPSFHEHLTARRNLHLLAMLADGDRAEADELLAKVGLAERADAKTGGYSTGMRQRLGIAAALLGRPHLLILDEPTTGLDPEGRESILRLIRQLAAEYGPTVLFTSHIFDEVSRLCDRAGILHGGALVHEGPAGDATELRRIYFEHTGREDMLS